MEEENFNEKVEANKKKYKSIVKMYYECDDEFDVNSLPISSIYSNRMEKDQKVAQKRLKRQLHHMAALPLIRILDCVNDRLFNFIDVLNALVSKNNTI